MKGTVVILLIFAFSWVAQSRPADSSSDEKSGFFEDLIASKLEGVLQDFQHGDYKVEFQIKKKDQYHDFCLRIQSKTLTSVTNLVFGREKVIKPCVGFQEVEEDGTLSLNYRMRVGSTELYSGKIGLDKTLSACRDMAVFGKVCARDFKYLTQITKQKKRKVQTACLTLILPDQKLKLDMCGYFIGMELKDYKFEKQEYVPGEEEDIPVVKAHKLDGE